VRKKEHGAKGIEHGAWGTAQRAWHTALSSMAGQICVTCSPERVPHTRTPHPATRNS